MPEKIKAYRNLKAFVCKKRDNISFISALDDKGKLLQERSINEWIRLNGGEEHFIEIDFENTPFTPSVVSSRGRYSRYAESMIQIQRELHHEGGIVNIVFEIQMGQFLDIIENEGISKGSVFNNEYIISGTSGSIYLHSPDDKNVEWIENNNEIVDRYFHEDIRRDTDMSVQCLPYSFKQLNEYGYYCGIASIYREDLLYPKESVMCFYLPLTDRYILSSSQYFDVSKNGKCLTSTINDEFPNSSRINPLNVISNIKNKEYSCILLNEDSYPVMMRQLPIKNKEAAYFNKYTSPYAVEVNQDAGFTYNIHYYENLSYKRVKDESGNTGYSSFVQIVVPSVNLWPYNGDEENNKSSLKHNNEISYGNVEEFKKIFMDKRIVNIESIFNDVKESVSNGESMGHNGYISNEIANILIGERYLSTHNNRFNQIQFDYKSKLGLFFNKDTDRFVVIYYDKYEINAKMNHPINDGVINIDICKFRLTVYKNPSENKVKEFMLFMIIYTDINIIPSTEVSVGMDKFEYIYRDSHKKVTTTPNKINPCKKLIKG